MWFYHNRFPFFGASSSVGPNSLLIRAMSSKRKEYKVDARAKKAALFFLACEPNPVTRLSIPAAMRAMIGNHDATALSAFAFATTVAPYAPYPLPPPSRGSPPAAGRPGGAAAGPNSQFTPGAREWVGSLVQEGERMFRVSGGARTNTDVRYEDVGGESRRIWGGECVK